MKRFNPDYEMNQMAGQATPRQMPPPSDSEIELIARVCHEANRAYCTALGDDSQPAWESAPAWQKQSARDGVVANLVPGGLRIRQPEDSHNSWMETKLRTGWRWGPKKDPEKKEHPSLLPYRSLTPEERRKDLLFMAICNALDPSRTNP